MILLVEKPTRETKHYFDEYLVHNGKVYRRLTNDSKKAVSQDARMQICRLCHDDAGHLGVEKRWSTSRGITGMRRFVNKYVRTCLHCVL